jgi:hypothetical protein
MEDIEIDDDRFMSFCVKFECLGDYFVSELNDTADITTLKKLGSEGEKRQLREYMTFARDRSAW